MGVAIITVFTGGIMTLYPYLEPSPLESIDDTQKDNERGYKMYQK